MSQGLTVGAMLFRDKENCACLEDFASSPVCSVQYEAALRLMLLVSNNCLVPTIV